MDPVTKRYFDLSYGKQKEVQLYLCELAYKVWLSHIKDNKIEGYTESVTASFQEVDQLLPLDAIEAVRLGKDTKDVYRRYLEPIVAMQDSDFSLPSKIEYAYYSIYNLYNYYISKKLDDSWLIINQALSALGDKESVENLEIAIETL